MFDENYKIPEEIKVKFTDEFCKAMRRALFRISGYYGLGTPAESGPVQNSSTSGWVVALFTACMETNNEDLFAYWHNLPWYESDVFDDELMEYMMDNNYLLGYMEDIIIEKLKIKREDLVCCACCGSYFTRDMGREITLWEECSREWVCHYCIERDDGQEGRYYREQLSKMEDWMEEKNESKA